MKSDRDRADLVEWMRLGLEELAASAEDGATVHELQLIVQISPALRYPAWRAARQKKWDRTQYSTHGWPTSLESIDSAALLLPVPAGRAGRAIGAHPQNTVSPRFTVIRTSGTPRDAALALLTGWVCNPGPGETARLAPPVIETVGHRRAVETFGRYRRPTTRSHALRARPGHDAVAGRTRLSATRRLCSSKALRRQLRRRAPPLIRNFDCQGATVRYVLP